MDTQLQNQAFTALSVAEASTLDALFEQLFPGDENGPGASAIGVIQYLDRALSGPYALHLETYRLGVYALDTESERRFGKPFAGTDGSQQSELIGALERNSAPNFQAVGAKTFFELVRSHLQEGLFSDPDNTAMSPQVKIAGCQRLRNRLEGRIPFIPGKRAEPVTPGAVSRRGAATIWDSVNPDSHRMGVQTESFRGFSVEFAQAERARGRHRQRLASLDERIRFVTCNAYFVLKKNVIRLQFFIGNWPIRQGASLRQHRKAPPVLDVAQHFKVMRVKAPHPTAIMDD